MTELGLPVRSLARTEQESCRNKLPPPGKHFEHHEPSTVTLPHPGVADPSITIESLG